MVPLSLVVEPTEIERSAGSVTKIQCAACGKCQSSKLQNPFILTVKTVHEFRIAPPQVNQPRVNTPAMYGKSLIDAFRPLMMKLETSSSHEAKATKIARKTKELFIVEQQDLNCRRGKSMRGLKEIQLS
jgi:hypothetical protein